MSYYHVQSHRAKFAWEAAAVIAVLLLVTAAIAGWASSRPLKVSVDGQTVEISQGATVRALADKSAFKAPAGDLIGVDGSVVGTGAGEPPRVLRNGRVAASWQRLYSGDVIVSRAGSDRRESLVVTEVPIPFETEYKGTGSLIEERRAGVAGARRVTRGAVSGVEISSETIREPKAALVQRFHPHPGSKIVALTFDDGPWPGQTDKILDILKREKATATFFMLGSQVKRHPALARRVVAEGHEVGNHTLGHKALTRVTPAEARRQIAGGRAAIARQTGVQTRLLRPPYGAMDPQAWQEARKSRTRVVLWDVDSRDWSRPGTKKIVTSVVSHTHPGAIVLFHDGGGTRDQTIMALPYVIRELRAKGYVFVTVDELFAVRRAAAAKNTQNKPKAN